MRYFFNDAEVTESEYLELMSRSVPDVPAKFTVAIPNTPAVRKVKPKKEVTRVVTGKSKIDQACEIVSELKSALTKEQLITHLMLKLGDITKGNATIYYNKALAKL